MKTVKLENGNYKEIRYWDNKETRIQSEQYYNSKDEFHRVDGPANIWYLESGEINSEDYIINNKYHRLNGPAEIYYYKSGEINSENYYINGKRNRLNGPARILYYKNWKTDKEYYYINDIEYSKEEFNKLININRNLKLLSKV